MDDIDDRVLARKRIRAKEELEYLRWIFANLDFGPAHEVVMGSMNRRYTEDTGRRVPEEYA